MGEKTAKQGDTVSGYAKEHGMPADKIWGHQKNKDLRDRREHANILHPGDVVFIPETERKDASADTDQQHRFVKQGGLEISIAVLDVFHKPLVGVDYHFVVDGNVEGEGGTDASGIARTRIPSTKSNVALHLPWGEFPLQVGDLDPTRTIKGLQKRLRNLGIDPGPIDGVMGPRTARALREFQLAEADAGLRPTGLADEKTLKRLREVHDGQTLEGIHNTIESHAPADGNNMEQEEMDSTTCENPIEHDELGAAEDTAPVSFSEHPE